MNAVKARVVNGRLVIEEPTDLPDGTELYLLPVGEEDEDRVDIEEANSVLEAFSAAARQALRRMHRQLSVLVIRIGHRRDVYR